MRIPAHSPAVRGACWAALLTAGFALSVLASYSWLQALCLAACFLPLLVFLSRFELAGLVISFLVAQNLAHLLKRAIFLLGPQSQTAYLGVQLLPVVVLAVLLFVAVQRFPKRALPPSARLLIAFLALAFLSTLMSVGHLPVMVLGIGVHQQLLPFLLFFVGCSLTLTQFARIGRAMAVLAGLSVVYGLVQLIGGPTALDQAWAGGTHHYSIHGGKVFAYLEGTAREFRAFSYYADPLTWGMFLVAGFMGAAVARGIGKMTKFGWILVTLAVLVGLFLSLTRTSWAGLLVTVVVYAVFRHRSFRRPWLAFALVIMGFVAAVAGGEFLYRELFLSRRLPVVDNPIVARYLTVGTIEARISAHDALREATASSPLLGHGYGLMLHAMRGEDGGGGYQRLMSHNFLVELVFNTGVPGLLLFLCFYLQWLREGFRALRQTADDRVRRVLRWIIAFSVGSLITGYLNGPTFMTYELFLFLGVVSGYAAQHSKVSHAEYAWYRQPIAAPGATRSPRPAFGSPLG